MLNKTLNLLILTLCLDTLSKKLSKIHTSIESISRVLSINKLTDLKSIQQPFRVTDETKYFGGMIFLQ